MVQIKCGIYNMFEKKLEPVFKFKKKIIYWKTNSFKDLDRFKRSRKYVFSRETL